VVEVKPLALAVRVVASDHVAVLGAEAVAVLLRGVVIRGGVVVYWDLLGWSFVARTDLVLAERCLELVDPGVLGGDGGLEAGDVDAVGFVFVVLLFAVAGGVSVDGCVLGGSHFGVLV
jgi:hypothetical protein